MTVPEHPTSPEHPIPTSTPLRRPDAGVDAGAAPESVPQVWDESRDPAFFALTARLFSPATTLAMTVLLASHDLAPLGDDAGSDYRS